MCLYINTKYICTPIASGYVLHVRILVCHYEICPRLIIKKGAIDYYKLNIKRDNIDNNINH